MIPIIIMIIENDDDREFMIGLYTKYNNLLLINARKIVHDDYVAEDMVQNTLANLIENIDKVRQVKICTLPGYLVICIKRVCFDYLKHKKVVDAHSGQSMDNDEFNFEYEDKTKNVENDVLLSLDIEELENALSLLPKKLQDVLEFKYILGLTDEEIANIVGLKKNSVRQYLTMARRKAYEKLKENNHE